MNEKLFSTYRSTIKNSFTSILDDLHNNQLTIKSTFKERGITALSALFFFLISFILLLVRRGKRIIVKRLEHPDTNVDDLVHALAARLEEGPFCK